ncbi:hypothetical protein MKX01_007618, partial [Papaver californicum]
MDFKYGSSLKIKMDLVLSLPSVIFLKHKFDLVSLTISVETLVSHVAEQLFQNAVDQDQELNQALEALPRFRTGIDVNIRFDKIDGFVDMPELAVFRLLKIPLYHGWMVDPQGIVVGSMTGICYVYNAS